MPSQHTTLPSPLLCTVKIFHVEGSKNQGEDRWGEWIKICVIYFQKYSLIMDSAELFLTMHGCNLYFQWTKRGWLPWQSFATRVYQLYWMRPVMIFSIPPKKFWVNIQIMPQPACTFPHQLHNLFRKHNRCVNTQCELHKSIRYFLCRDNAQLHTYNLFQTHQLWCHVCTNASHKWINP